MIRSELRALAYYTKAIGDLFLSVRELSRAFHAALEADAEDDVFAGLAAQLDTIEGQANALTVPQLAEPVQRAFLSLVASRRPYVDAVLNGTEDDQDQPAVDYMEDLEIFRTELERLVRKSGELAQGRDSTP